MQAIMDNFDDNNILLGTLYLLKGQISQDIPEKVQEVVDRQIVLRGNVSFRFNSHGFHWKYEAIGASCQQPSS